MYVVVAGSVSMGENRFSSSFSSSRLSLSVSVLLGSVVFVYPSLLLSIDDETEFDAQGTEV